MTPEALLAEVEAAPKGARTDIVLSPDAVLFAASMPEIARMAFKHKLKAAGVIVSDWWRAVEIQVRLNRARAAATAEGDEEGAAWEQELSRGPQGKPEPTPRNLGLILRNWTRTQSLRLNELTLEAELDERPLSDGGYFKLREEVEGAFGTVASSELMSDAVGAVAESRAYHPIRDYLDGLQWDGKQRLAEVPRRILLAPPEPLYGRMVTAWFVSAVARIYDPGCKVDTCLTLYSHKGGKNKTTFFDVVAGERWVTSGHVDPSDKDSVLVAHQSWIKLLDEVDDLTRRSEWSPLKRWMTERSDTFRAPYGRRPARYPRRFIFGGTTNKEEYIPPDDAAARRFWTLPVGDGGPEQMALLADRRDQLFAEAREIYLGGTGHRTRKPDLYLWWLTPEESDAAQALSRKHQAEPQWADKIEGWLSSPMRNGQTVYRTEEILDGAMKLTDPHQHTRAAKENVGDAMRFLGWTMTNKTINGEQKKAWVKP